MCVCVCVCECVCVCKRVSVWVCLGTMVYTVYACMYYEAQESLQCLAAGKHWCYAREEGRKEVPLPSLPKPGRRVSVDQSEATMKRGPHPPPPQPAPPINTSTSPDINKSNNSCIESKYCNAINIYRLVKLGYVVRIKPPAHAHTYTHKHRHTCTPTHAHPHTHSNKCSHTINQTNRHMHTHTPTHTHTKMCTYIVHIYVCR